MINVNSIYEAVLRLMGKNQNGTISPKDFNTYAQLANIQLFNRYYGEPSKYRYDSPLSNIAYAQTQQISEALGKFLEPNVSLTLTNGNSPIPNNSIHTVNINSLNGSSRVSIKRVEHDRLYSFLNSSIDAPDAEFPIYVELDGSLQFYPSTITDVKITYLREPEQPIWAYTLVSGRPVYDAGNSVDFEWDSDEFDWLVYKILSLAGVSLQDQLHITAGEKLSND